MDKSTINTIVSTAKYFNKVYKAKKHIRKTLKDKKKKIIHRNSKKNTK